MSDLDGYCFVKRGGHLIPADRHADESIASLKEGGEVLISIRRPRNIRHHRLLFAENCDQWASVEILMDELKLATGLAEIRVNLLTGKPYAVPSSINFAAMNQDKFATWFGQVVHILATKALKTAPQAFLDEILAMVDPQRSAA